MKNISLFCTGNIWQLSSPPSAGTNVEGRCWDSCNSLIMARHSIACVLCGSVTRKFVVVEAKAFFKLLTISATPMLNSQTEHGCLQKQALNTDAIFSSPRFVCGALQGKKKGSTEQKRERKSSNEFSMFMLNMDDFLFRGMSENWLTFSLEQLTHEEFQLW